jgi:hypothetical protein
MPRGSLGEGGKGFLAGFGLPPAEAAAFIACVNAPLTPAHEMHAPDLPVAMGAVRAAV